MTDKRKKLARALSKKTGMSHQAAVNALTATTSEAPAHAGGRTHGPFIGDGTTTPKPDDNTFVGDGGSGSTRAHVFSGAGEESALVTMAKAADAAWLTLEAAGFRKLDATAWRVLEADGQGLNRTGDHGGIYYLAPTYTVRFYTELPITNPMTEVTTKTPIVFSLIVAPARIHFQITTEPDGGILYGVGEEPPTVEGAKRAATRMINWVRERFGEN